MRQACESIVQGSGGRLKVGSVVATKGFKLPAKQVLHVVAPAFHKDCKGDEKLAFEYLHQAYASIFEYVNQLHIPSLAIPGISTGNNAQNN